ncbi:hypothetical protein GPA19_12685 [Azoarcus indigens]|uniref:Uncharacterized protein n=1 Tax=Azoarcus indigens TaxID=29545 RepID=A0A4R6DU02_9RHOO|nr:hypothetical protein [Azoarcus indigens]NMG65803.1 hypothetical protein [Azoarcus indigens]TDN48666.1 hypothetical protein C7389_11453 [Azoarcus indigens]
MGLQPEVAADLGNAIGAWLGGLALTHGLSYDDIPWVGTALAGLLFSIHPHRLECRDQDAGTLLKPAPGAAGAP